MPAAGDRRIAIGEALLFGGCDGPPRLRPAAPNLDWLNDEGEEMMDFAAKPAAVVFLCPKCGALFRADQHRARDPSPGKFECSNCSTAVFQWAGEYDYSDWRDEA